MTDIEKILAALERIEKAQAKALELQAAHTALYRAQVEKTDASVSESMQLQRLAVERQAKAMRGVWLPVIMAAVFLVYLIARN